MDAIKANARRVVRGGLCRAIAIEKHPVVCAEAIAARRSRHAGEAPDLGSFALRASSPARRKLGFPTIGANQRHEQIRHLGPHAPFERRVASERIRAHLPPRSLNERSCDEHARHARSQTIPYTRRHGGRRFVARPRRQEARWEETCERAQVDEDDVASPQTRERDEKNDLRDEVESDPERRKDRSGPTKEGEQRKRELECEDEEPSRRQEPIRTIESKRRYGPVLGPFPIHLVSEIVGKSPRDSRASKLVNAGEEINRREKDPRNGQRLSRAANQSRCMSCQTWPPSWAMEKR